jgi:hypothetical protein
MRSLGKVSLVDADLIRPQQKVFIAGVRRPKVPSACQRVAEVGKYVALGTIDEYDLCITWIAGAIREGQVFASHFGNTCAGQ